MSDSSSSSISSDLSYFSFAEAKDYLAATRGFVNCCSDCGVTRGKWQQCFQDNRGKRRVVTIAYV